MIEKSLRSMGLVFKRILCQIYGNEHYCESNTVLVTYLLLGVIDESLRVASAFYQGTPPSL